MGRKAAGGRMGRRERPTWVSIFLRSGKKEKGTASRQRCCYLTRSFFSPFFFRSRDTATGPVADEGRSKIRPGVSGNQGAWKERRGRSRASDRSTARCRDKHDACVRSVTGPGRRTAKRGRGVSGSCDATEENLIPGGGEVAWRRRKPTGPENWLRVGEGLGRSGQENFGQQN